MSLIPRDVIGKINFCVSKNTPWSSNAVAIGTTTTEVTALATKTTSAQTALAAQIAAQEAARAATLDLQNKVSIMIDAASDIIKKIRAKAATDGNNVYVLAQIPAPAVPSPMPPPGEPSAFTAQLSQGGALTISWKCTNPPGSGCVYEIARQIGSGSMSVIGITGTKKFVDETLPAGAGSGAVTYRVIGVRSTARGPEALFTVRFGISGSGEMTAMVMEAPKLAA